MEKSKLSHHLEQVKIARTGALMRFITSHPTSFGVLVAIAFSVGIVVTVTWFPGMWEFHDRHKRLVQAILFTAIYFPVYVYGLRPFRRLRVFWPTICALFVVHISAITLYSLRVQPILVWQWPIVGFAEYFGVAIVLQRLTETRKS
jgi:hypothetical protein